MKQRQLVKLAGAKQIRLTLAPLRRSESRT
jgi:hypothetical protein